MDPPSETPVPTTMLSTCWCMTLNNYTPEEVDECRKFMEDERVLGFVIGEEVCPTTGTPHLQGYIRLAKNCRLSTLKKHWPRAHFEKRLKSEKAAWDYCKKDGKVLFEKGEPRLTAQYGSRDAEAAAVVDKVERGYSYRDIRREHKVFCFWHRRHVLDCMSDTRLEQGSSEPGSTRMDGYLLQYSPGGYPVPR